jgi:hypothetical protein
MLNLTDYSLKCYTLSSTYERGRDAENAAKKWLQNKFNISFSRRNLQVGLKSNGKPALHNFDLVSEDNQIVAEVKSHQLTKGENIPSGKVSDTYQACFMLEKVTTKKKLLILSDPKFFEIFKRYSEGKISKEIEIVLLPNRNEAKKPNNVKTTTLQSMPKKPKKTGFDIFWSRLTSWLSYRQHIRNWTVKNGEIGEDFEAVHAGGNYIIVYPKSALHVQRVPKNDFKVIYEKWDEYKAELIPRSYFVKGPIAHTRFSKYIISIIHQCLNSKKSKKQCSH